MRLTKKIFYLILKVVLFILLFYYIYIQLINKNVSWSDLINVFNNTTHNYLFLIITVFLMPINWILESYKWKKLVHVVQKDYNIFIALKSVLIGVFFGFITPSRIGEFGGRLYKIKKGKKIKALNLSILGGISQFVITFSIGLISSFFFIKDTLTVSKSNIIILMSLLLMITYALYFNIDGIIKRISSFKYFQNFSKKYIFTFSLNKKILLKILVITFIRYLIYVTQYVLIFKFFGVDLDLIFIYSSISLMLLIQTILPSFALVDLGIRGNILLNLLSNHIDNQFIILISILLVWILNLVIPAIVGYIYFLTLKNENYEKDNNHISTII